MRAQQSLFEDQRTTLADAIELSLASLRAYGERYQHWSVAYSGGKDSSATVTFVAWALREKLIPQPESVTVLYADTRMELPPLQRTAVQMLAKLSESCIETRMVLPEMDDRFFVYMLGYGVPPPKNRFRWCTQQLKVDPMMNSLRALRDASGQKLLSITGVRLGESAARDARIAVSCSRDSGECGQGWFQVATPDSIADTLAPLLHWRVCHVFDWLYFETEKHGYPDVLEIASVYGEEDVRTGCVGCNLASRDTALERLLKNPNWAHLSPLLGLKPLYAELTMAKWRKRKAAPELRQDGQWSMNAQRLGPLTMEARAYGLARVLDIQQRSGMDLINAEEEARIREMWRLNMWPRKWTGDEITGDKMIDAIRVVGNEIITQPLLVR
jgi:DNA sulfur modification protein DndC